MECHLLATIRVVSLETTGLTTRARALTAAIRRLLDASGMSGREVSQRLGFSHGTVSHWVTGRRLPSPEDMASLLTLLHITGQEKQRLIELARHAGEPNWLVVGMHGIPQQLAGAIESERQASAMFEWARDLIPGLLQTADYARAVATGAGLCPAEIDSRTMIRIGRAEILTRRHRPLPFTAVIGEDALRERIASPEVMSDQLRHLVQLSRRENVTVRLLPPRIGWHPGMLGPFVVYDFADAPSAVYFEHYRSGAFVLDEGDVQTYREAIAVLCDLARNPSDSTDVMMAMAEETERTAW